MRENKRVLSSNRELHEAMYYKHLYQGPSIDPVNVFTWLVVALGSGGFWWWVVSL
jgi:hypothetical protein